MSLSCGDVFRAMWTRTVQLYPELAEIDDDAYIHAILACSTKEQQGRLLAEFRAMRAVKDQSLAKASAAEVERLRHENRDRN